MYWQLRKLRQPQFRMILLLDSLSGVHIYLLLTQTLVYRLSVLLPQDHNAWYLVRLLQHCELTDSVWEVKHDVSIEFAVRLTNALDHQFGHQFIFQLFTTCDC